MKRLYCLFAFLCVSAIGMWAQVAPPQSIGGGYTLKWSDEFNGTSLDEDVWNIEVNGDGGGNGELQYYCRKGVSVADGKLHLKATRETSGGKPFTSGRINSKSKIFFTYGKIEARIKLPKTYKGLWPAFWMMGNDIDKNPWPKCGELDILEMGNKSGWTPLRNDYTAEYQSERFLNGACHWGASWNAKADYAGEGHEAKNMVTRSIQGEYYVFGCEWDEDIMRCYVRTDDGSWEEEYFRMGNGITPGKDPAWEPGTYFRKDNFILFNLAVGGMYPDIYDPAAITAIGAQQGSQAEMLVDWVAVYQKDGNGSSFTDNRHSTSGEASSEAHQFTGDRYYLIDFVDDEVIAEKLMNKEVIDWRVNDKTRHLYIWDNNWSTGSKDGPNIYGHSGAFQSYTANAGYAGLGYAYDQPNDLSAFTDEYKLHMDVKTTDVGAFTLTFAGKRLTIGEGYEFDTKINDGKWHSLDIPVSAFGIDFSSMHGFTGNMFAIENSAGAGTNLQYGSVFVYGPSNNGGMKLTANPRLLYAGESADLTLSNGNNILTADSWSVSPSVMGTVEGGKFIGAKSGSALITANYGSHTVTTNVDIFKNADAFSVSATPHQFTAEKYYVVNLDPTNISKISNMVDLRVDDSNVALYNWDYGFASMAEGTGTNIYGQTGGYNNFTCARNGYNSGAYFVLQPKNLTGIDDTYKFHIDVKLPATGRLSLGVKSAKLKIGAAADNDIVVTPNQWQSIDIPVSYLNANTTYFTGDTGFTGNFVILETGDAVQGDAFSLGGIFFYGDDNGEISYDDDVAVTGVSLAATATVKKNESIKLTPKFTPANATNKKVTWKSDNEAVAKVANGVVTAIAEGQAKITLTTEDGSFTATCVVTVTAADVTAPTLVLGAPTSTQTSASFTVTATDDSAPITITVKDGENVKATKSVNSGAETTISIDGLTPGTQYTFSVTATDNSSAKNVSEAKTVSVKTADPIRVSGVTLDKTTAELTVGKGTVALVATVTPANATDKAVTWTSSNEAVATVENGVVTPVAAGKATITATTADGNKTAVCDVTVKSAHAKAVEPQVLTNGNHEIKLYPVDNGDGTYTLTIKSEETMNGMGGSFWHINGVGTDMRNTLVRKDDGKTMVITVESSSKPQPYTPIYIMMPGEVNFGSVTLNWQEGEISDVVPSVYNHVVPTTTSDDPKVTADHEHGDIAFTWTTEENGDVTITVSPVAGNTNAYFRGQGMNGKEGVGFTLNGSADDFNAYFDKVFTTGSDTYTLALKGDRPANGSVIAYIGQIELWTDNAKNDWSTFAFTKFQYGSVAADDAPVESVTLDKATAMVKAGNNLKLTATVNPSYAANLNVTWSSSDNNVATVNNGVVTVNANAAVGATATITVTTEDGGKTATCVVTVVDAVPSAYNNVIPTTTSEDPKVTAANNHGDIAFTWTTLNNGNVAITVGPAPGTTSAKFRNTGMNGTFTLNGSADEFASYFNKGKADDGTYMLTLKDAARKPADGSIIAYSGQIECATSAANDIWSNFSFARFEYGSVAGEPEAVAVESVTLSKNTAEVKPGKTLTLTATVNPLNASNQNVTWSSSNTSVATVENGVVTVKTGAAVGATATITVTTEDGGKTASCVVTVADSTLPDTGADWFDSVAGIDNGLTYDVEYAITYNDDKTITVEVLSMEGTLFDKNPNKQFNFAGEWPFIVDNKVTSAKTFNVGEKPEMFFWFPYAGGVARVDVKYTVGGKKVPDVTAPVDFTATIASVSDNYVSIEMKAKDEASEKINYIIKLGDGTTYNVSGNNNEVTKYNVENLTPETQYSITVTAADAAGNLAANTETLTATTKSARGEGVALAPVSSANYTMTGDIINLDGVVTISNARLTRNNDAAKETNNVNISIDKGIVGMTRNADGTFSYTVSGNSYLPGDKVNGFYYIVYEGGADRIDFSFTVPENAGWDKTGPQLVSVGVKEGAATPSSVTLEALATDENGTQVKYLVYQGENHIATLVGNSGETVSQRVGGLTENTAYEFTVVAMDVVGNLSADNIKISATTGSFQLVWSDEFDSNTLGKNWNVEVNGDGGGNWEQQYYTDRPQNVNIVDGNLVLTAIREKFSMPGDENPHNYTSGRVNSKNLVTFKHGKIEARIKLPKTKKGLWPAFWTMGNDIDQVGWPKCGEIDIMEAGHQNGFGGNEETYFSGCIHWGEAWDTHGYWDGSVVNPYSIMDDEYHVYTCVWEDEWLRCYLDDQKEPYYNAAISKTIDPNIVSADYMHKPNFILFNLAVGGQFPGLYDEEDITALPEPGSTASMYVDYVRVYQSDNNVQCKENDADKITDNVAPANFVLTDKAPAIVATATDNSNNTISYTVMNGTKAVAFGAAKSGESATIDIKGLVVGKTYTLTVVASDVFGNTAEKDITITIPGTVDPTEAAPGTSSTDASNIVALYTDKYDTPAVNTNAAWWNWPTLNEEAIDDDHYLEYSENMGGVIGWEYAPIDASECNYMHIDIWPSATGVITIEPITSISSAEAYSASIALDVTGGQWNAFDIPVSDFLAINPDFRLDGLNQMKIAGYGAQTQFCIDNVFFFHSDTITGISVNAANNANAKVYGINGQQYNSNAKLAKGIYIVNGKKIVK